MLISVDIYELPHNPREKTLTLLESARTERDLMRDYGLSPEEISEGLNGEVIRGRYRLQFNDEWLRKTILREFIQDNLEGMDLTEIAALLGVSYSTAHEHFKNALDRLAAQGKLREFLHTIANLRALRDRRGHGYEIVTSTKVTFTVH